MASSNGLDDNFIEDPIGRSRKRALQDRSNSLPVVAPAASGGILPSFIPNKQVVQMTSSSGIAHSRGLGLPPIASLGCDVRPDATKSSLGGFQRVIDRHVTDVNQRKNNLERSKLESRRLLQELSEKKQEFKSMQDQERLEKEASYQADAEIAQWDTKIRQKKEQVAALQRNVAELRAKKNNTVEEITQLSRDFIERANEMKVELREVCAQYSHALETKENAESGSQQPSADFQ